MQRCLRWKFTSTESMYLLLTGTDPHRLIHHAPWDAYWGSGSAGQGLNRQGELTMSLRSALLTEKVRPRTVAVVGSRGFTDARFLGQTLEDLRLESPFNTLISGGARGADRLGESWARVNDLSLVVFPAEWDRHGKRAGYIRNHWIVTAASVVVAFWDGQSPGTKHTIEIAKTMGKPVIIHHSQ